MATPPTATGAATMKAKTTRKYVRKTTKQAKTASTR